MSLEAKIEILATAVTNLAIAIGQQTHTTSLTTTPVASATPAILTPAPVVQAAPPVPEVQPPPPPVPAPGMPPLPTFAQSPPAPAATGICPFNDGKGLIEYVMNTYKALGPQKGALIQGVLVSLGYQNINDVKSDHYQALFSGIEALKAKG